MEVPTSLSVIIPLYNEEENVGHLLAAISGFLAGGEPGTCEFIFVDDGSQDKTQQLLQEFVDRHTDVARLVVLGANRGKGYAVRTGMLAATRQWRVFLDADLAVSLDHLNDLLLQLRDGCQVVVGSRTLPASVILRRQGVLRQLFGTAYTLLARMITGVNASDFTCGFKCFSREAALQIFTQAKIDRWSYDAEILYLAKQFAVAVCEMPVRWRNGPRSTVRIAKDTLQSLSDLIRIRVIHRSILHGKH